MLSEPNDFSDPEFWSIFLLDNLACHWSNYRNKSQECLHHRMSGRKRKLRKVNQLQAIGLVLFLALVAVGYRYYKMPKNLVGIHFELPDSQKSSTLYVSLALDKASRTRGLMFVKDMPASRGMLFAFPEQKQQVFHMKNTYIPLDMIFIDQKGKVVGILHDVPQLNELRRSVKDPSKYVLELNGGRARELGITVGSQLVMPNGLPTARN